MHDFQHATAEVAMDLLNDLKAGGYKIAFMQPKFAVTTIAACDETIVREVPVSLAGKASEIIFVTSRYDDFVPPRVRRALFGDRI
jgi:hypothetical protein